MFTSRSIVTFWVAFAVPAILVGLWVLGAVPPMGHHGLPLTNVVEVTMNTSLGRIRIELYPDISPNCVANFLEMVDAHEYDGTLIHFVRGNLAGGGLFGTDWNVPHSGKRPQVSDVSDLRNERGTIAVASSDTNNFQPPEKFYLNLNDNPELDHWPALNGIKLTVFGRIVEGVDVLDQIRGVDCGTHQHPDGFVEINVPVQPIVIQSISRI